MTLSEGSIVGSPGLARKATNLGNPKRWGSKGEKKTRKRLGNLSFFVCFFLVLCEFFGEVKDFEV